MATCVRSYSKINLGLAIGPVREDGFHGLATLYQTLALHDVVTVSVGRVGLEGARITLSTNHPGVPVDGRNTAWKMVALALARMGVAAEETVHIEIEKRLPVQGGMGAGSANAAAALIGLERELGVALPAQARLELAAEVGSDVPLFLIGGAVLGVGRGEIVSGMSDLPAMACVVAVPEVGVSTPAAFRDWDERARGQGPGARAVGPGDQAEDRLTSSPQRDRLEKLSHVYASVLRASGGFRSSTTEASGASGIVRGLGLRPDPEKKQGGSDEVPERGLGGEQGSTLNGLAENPLLALVRTGIENDFEEVVFPQYPLLREIKHELMGTPIQPGTSAESNGRALYAALSGSGSALFGLYGSAEDARAAQQRVQALGCKALLTETLPRQEYWRTMFAE